MADYIIGWIDDTQTVRDATLTVEDDKCVLNLHNKIRVNSSKYTLQRRHKFVKYEVNNTASGNIRGYYEGIYLDNDTPRIEISEVKESYSLNFNNSIRIDHDWSKLQISAHAGNELCQYLFNCKDIFDVTSNKPDEPIVFNHPTIFSFSSTSDSGANDGTITVTPRGGADNSSFEVKLGAASESWVLVVGASHTFTGLTAGGGNNTDGSWQVRVRDNSSVVSKIENVFVNTLP